MENCLIQKLKASIDNPSLKYLGEACRIHANVTMNPAGAELSIGGGNNSEITVIITDSSKHMTSGGIDLPNPYTFTGNAAFSLPHGEYDIIVLNINYSLNKIQLYHPETYFTDISNLENFNITFFATNINPLSPKISTELISQWSDIIDVRCSAKCFGDLSAIYNLQNLTFFDANNSEVTGETMDLYVHHAGYGAKTCTYIYGTRATFNGNEILVRHVVTYDGNGGCVVRDGQDNVLGTYDGSSWTFPS